MSCLKRKQFWNALIVGFTVISLLVVGFIFYNSYEDQEASSERSSKISETVQSVVDPESKIDKKEFHNKTRKVAHAIEFGVFGLALGGLMFSIFKRYGRCYLGFSLFTMLAVAVSDEFIQEFNDRSSQASDALIDFGGAFAGFLLMLLLMTLILRFVRKRRIGKGKGF